MRASSRWRGSLEPERILGVETGGCPHTAIREDASINLRAIADMQAKFPKLDLVLIESGGDNLAATFSPELADITVYVIDVAGGENDPPARAGRASPGSDLLVVNKTDLAPMVGADLGVMETDTIRMRAGRPVCVRVHPQRRGRGCGGRLRSSRPAACRPEGHATWGNPWAVRDRPRGIPQW